MRPRVRRPGRSAGYRGAVKYFNTAGPCDPDRHYMLPAAERLPEAFEFVEFGQYFVLHAPRQTGKTTTLAALAREITVEGHYLALHFTCEEAEPLGDDYENAERVVLGSMRVAARQLGLTPDLMPPDPWPEAEPGQLLRESLIAWSARCPRPLVLFFDEIDALRGESLRSVLRQLRAGYTTNKARFPHSVALCGLRDVRDYKAASGGDPLRLGSASPFNIKIASVRLGDFTFDEVSALYALHTAETGQEFTSEAVERAYRYTMGQPWLVNALAFEITRRMRVELSTPITVEHVDVAKERLIQARATHLDSLVSTLSEPRVQRVVEPLIAGDRPPTATYNDDVMYVRDLGLVGASDPVAIANPIYREVITRVLSQPVIGSITEQPRDFVLPDGRIDVDKLLRGFVDFRRGWGELMSNEKGYHEAGAQLVMLGYLYRIVNGGGFVDSEYGIGRRRIDILIRKPYGVREMQREALELKVWRDGESDPAAQGLVQLDAYLERLALGTGTLVIFDRRPTAPPVPERGAFTTERTPAGREVTLLRV